MDGSEFLTGLVLTILGICIFYSCCAGPRDRLSAVNTIDFADIDYQQQFNEYQQQFNEYQQQNIENNVSYVYPRHPYEVSMQQSLIQNQSLPPSYDEIINDAELPEDTVQITPPPNYEEV